VAALRALRLRRPTSVVASPGTSSPGAAGIRRYQPGDDLPDRAGWRLTYLSLLGARHLDANKPRRKAR
jgi:hypothetical protein